MSTYIDPGPTVYAGGLSKTPGNSKCTGQAASEGPGGKPATGVRLQASLFSRPGVCNRQHTLPALAVVPAPLSRLRPLPRPDLLVLLPLRLRRVVEVARLRSTDSVVALDILGALLAL
jgi:hypothetical protein